jgi:hypothetical protein
MILPGPRMVAKKAGHLSFDFFQHLIVDILECPAIQEVLKYLSNPVEYPYDAIGL